MCVCVCVCVCVFIIIKNNFILLSFLLRESSSYYLTLMVFRTSLNDNKSPQVSRILLSILADLSNAVVWIVSACSLISKPSTHFTNPSVIVLWAPIKIGINVTFMFHSFFLILLQGPGTYPSFRFLSTLLCGQAGQESPQSCRFSFFVIIIRFNCLVEIRGSVCISKSQRKTPASYSPGQILGCAYTVCSYGQILISCTVLSGSPCLPSLV